MTFSKSDKANFIYNAEKMSKGALVRSYADAAEKLSLWVEVAMSTLAYLYNIMPFAEIFKGKTFNEKTLDMIKERAKNDLSTLSFDHVIYLITDREVKEEPRIDLVNLTDENSFKELIKVINRERDKLIKEGRAPVNCSKCIFRESCSDSSTKTGVSIHACSQAQFESEDYE